jgi:hypothetical protein
MLGLIDADMTSHEVGHLHEGTGKFDSNGNEKKQLIPLRTAKRVCKGLFQSLLRRSEVGAYEAYVSGGKNFRHDIATLLPYKGTRDGSERHHADALKDYLRDELGAVECENIEADDAISIRMWNHWRELWLKYNGDETEVANKMDMVIVTRDKDLDNVPGWHFKWGVRGNEDPPPYYITFLQAIRNFYKQLLTGDTADNIKGLYGVGSKSAWVKQLDDMDNEDDMALHVHEKYVKHYGDYADKFMYESGNLLHMWRKDPDEWLAPWDRDDNYWEDV